MRKRFLATLLALAMVLSVTPFALADDSAGAGGTAGEAAESTWQEVSTSDALSAALSNGGNIKLTADITVSKKQNWAIEDGKTVVLDLNSHSITSSYGGNNNFIMTVSGGGSLTVTDNSQAKTGKIAATHSTKGYGIQLRSNGSFTLLGGTIETTQETVDIFTSAQNCSVTIAGGKLVSTEDCVLGVRGESTTVNISDGEMESAGRTAVYISNYGEPDSIQFTMTGGSLKHTDGLSGAMQIYNGATVTIAEGAQIDAEYTGLLAQENVVLNVTGGTIKAGRSAVSAEDEAQVNISGGEISSDSNSSTSGTVEAEGNAQVTITGGTLTSKRNNVYIEDEADATVTGGTFKKGENTDTDVQKYFPEGAALKQDNTGAIVPDTTVTPVAEVNNVGYVGLQYAINAAQSGDTITMLKEYDATNEGTITFNADKAVTLDLGGYELTLSRFDLVRGWLTVKNGSVKCDPTDGQAFNVYAGPTATEELYTKLVIEKDVTINAAYGICLFPGSGKAGYSSAIEVYGKIESGGIFVSGNLGNDKTTAKAMAESGKIPTVTIHEGAVVNNGSEGQGIAMNGLANVTVEGGTISGSEAIGVKRGTLTVEGGTFISNGDYVNPAEANHNGTENTGATISITSTYNYAGTINVNLNGGTFTSEKAPAVYLGHSEEKISGGQTTSSNVYAEGVTLNIQGGTFTSPDNAPTVYVAAKADGDADTYTQQVISGGTFSTKVRDYLDNSIRYEVAHQTGNFSYTKTMEDAQTLVQPGDTITELNVAQGTTTYSLTLDYNDGDVTADVTYTVSSGTTVTLPKPPARTNYTFGGWSDGTTTYNDGTSYTVNATVTLTAQWLYIPPVKPSYPVTLPAVTGGKVTASPAAAVAGATVTLTVVPDEGYELASLTVTDYLGNQIALSGSGSRYTFTMPASQVKVAAVFTKTGGPTLPFTDVSEDNWAYGDIVYVYENGLMQGDSATIFDRLSAISRKEIVTILYRLAGEPAVAADNGFADVADGVWYADAVNWAVAEGVTQGVGGNRFDPDAAITRQDLAVMLWRYAGEPAGDLSALEGYRDEDSVSGYARAALAWAVEQGIVTGVGDSTLDPMGSAQRQQAAAMIRRLAESVQA